MKLTSALRLDGEKAARDNLKNAHLNLEGTYIVRLFARRPRVEPVRRPREPRPVGTDIPSPATERARLAVVLTTIAISVVGVALFAAVPWSDWRTGLLLNLIENAILVAFSVRYKDRLIPHLMAFGLAAGV